MIKFISKIIYFAIFPLILFTLVNIVIDYKLNEQSIEMGIESKISNLKIDKNKINIIVAGDSRGERQLIPKIIESNTGYNSINIAVNAGDLVSTVFAIKKHYSGSNLIFIISASSWQINDGAISPGYLSAKCFQKLTTIEKLNFYKSNVWEFVNLYKKLIKQTILSFFSSDASFFNYDSKIISELGYQATSGVIAAFNSDKEVNNYLSIHPWYMNISNNGARWRIFQEAIRELSRIDSYFILLQPPVSPYWKKITKNTYIDIAEEEYSKKLNNLVLEYNNIDFYDFYSKDINELNDSMYYDYQHLNSKGAMMFSDQIMKFIDINKKAGERRKM